MSKDAASWIATLGLQKHPEGGYYRETYRASETVDSDALPGRFGGVRSYATAIYYLLCGSDFSALHRLRSDEMWHFYTGAPLTIHVIDPCGDYAPLTLGSGPERGEVFQAVVPAGCWFGATVKNPGTYALVGCTVAPGFDFTDFELAERDALLRRYQQHRALIESLTRTTGPCPLFPRSAPPGLKNHLPSTPKRCIP